MNSPDTIREFGIKRDDEERRDGGCGVVFDPQTQKYAVSKGTEDGFLRLFAGGVSEGEDMQRGVLREVTEESGLRDFEYVEKIAEAMTHYHNSLKNVNRVAKATCYLVILKTADLIPAQREEHEKFELVWATANEVILNWVARNQNKDYDHWIYFFTKAIGRAQELKYDTTSKVQS